MNSTEDIKDILVRMSKGNPGAAKTILKLLECGDDGIITVMNLNLLEIYGTDIWVLYKDICEENLGRMIAVIYAVKYELLDEKVLKDACSRQDRSGKELIPVEELYDKITNFKY